jgi:hypothetical protein
MVLETTRHMEEVVVDFLRSFTHRTNDILQNEELQNTFFVFYFLFGICFEALFHSCVVERINGVQWSCGYSSKALVPVYFYFGDL